jgi:hypothetical protein
MAEWQAINNVHMNNHSIRSPVSRVSPQQALPASNLLPQTQQSAQQHRDVFYTARPSHGAPVQIAREIEYQIQPNLRGSDQYMIPGLQMQAQKSSPVRLILPRSLISAYARSSCSQRLRWILQTAGKLILMSYRDRRHKIPFSQRSNDIYVYTGSDSHNL